MGGMNRAFQMGGMKTMEMFLGDEKDVGFAAGAGQLHLEGGETTPPPGGGAARRR
jgi:hypothetical protein